MRLDSPTLEAIARAADVSIPTASLALNDHRRVSARTKRRVSEVAAKLGYVPNQAARRLAKARFTQHSRKLDQVGFILYDKTGPELDGPYLSLMRGVEHQL